jgi:hypothetical protein
MLTKRRDRRYEVSVLVCLAALLFTLAFQLNSVYGACPGLPLPESYQEALLHSQKATQDKISRNLLALVPYEDEINKRELCGEKLVWQYDPMYQAFPTRLKVAAFMDRKTFYDNYFENLNKHARTYMLRKSLWVTVVPEMRNFFSRKIFKDAKQCPPSVERVGQVLGLNPNAQGEIFVEMWVEPKYLFRPSADPAVTDHEAEIAAQIPGNNWFFPSDPNPFMTINNENLFKDGQWTKPVTFKEWYIHRAETIYKSDPDVCNPYPWTRLGYTYDWGEPHRPKHEGLSEFVLRIDPDVDGGVAVVQLIRAIDSEDEESWATYFRCSRKCND